LKRCRVKKQYKRKEKIMPVEEFEVRGLKVRSFKSRAEFQEAIQEWIEGRNLDDSDFEDLWDALPEEKRGAYLKRAEKAYPAEPAKRPDHETKAEFADRMERSEESRLLRVQKEARKAFAASLPPTKLEKFEAGAQAVVAASNAAEVAGRKEHLEGDKEKRDQAREAREKERRGEGF